MKKTNLLRVAIRFILITVAALWMLFEDWVWNSILAVMDRLGRLRIVASLEAFLRRQNPYLLLSLFLFPFLIMLPAKLFGLYLIANGKVLRGISVFVTAKVVITALVTRLFAISRDRLLLIRPFALFYSWFIEKKEWLYAEVRKLPAWQAVRNAVTKLKHRLKRRSRVMSG